MTYKSAKQKEREQTLDAMLIPHRPKTPLTGPLELFFIAHMPIPASVSGKQMKAMLRGETGHTHKPDLDNLAKQLKDALTRCGFWHDDRQVVKLTCAKAYAASPGWVVAVLPDRKG